MGACIFNANIAVFENACSIWEISIQKGLKQGDPITPFIFLLGLEGLYGLMNREFELDLLFGFRVRSFNFVVSHIQYVDDTLIFANPSNENMGNIKDILRGFDLESSLRFNFSKSSLIRVNAGLTVWIKHVTLSIIS